MPYEIIYPENIERFLKDYEEKEHKKIKYEYNKIYRERIENFFDDIKTKIDQNLISFEEHNRILSAALLPFFTHKIKNYDLL